jgi:hypothetical protein
MTENKKVVRKLTLVLLAFSSLCFGAEAQTWQATELWGYPVPSQSLRGMETLPIPTSHDNISLVSIFTTKDTPALLGDLTGGTISATIQLVVNQNPMIWFGNDTGGPQQATIRLYFTTTTEPYNFIHGIANRNQYWWATFAMANLSTGNNAPACPGTYTLTATLDPSLWSNSEGNQGSDPAYTPEFYQAISQVAQIGFSFGGGENYDTGIGVLDASDPTPYPSATLYVLDYQVSRTIAISTKAPNPE